MIEADQRMRPPPAMREKYQCQYVYCVNLKDQDPLFFWADAMEVTELGDLRLVSANKQLFRPLIIFKRDVWLSCSISDPETGKSITLHEKQR